MKRLFFSAIILLLAASGYGQSPCSVQFSWAAINMTPTSGLGIEFTNTTVFTPTGTLKAFYQINVNDQVATLDPFYGPSYVHAYSAPGTYTVGMSMVVIDTFTQQVICTDSTTQLVVVNYIPCYTTITAVANGGGSYTFTANNIGGGTGLTYSWNFGDGASSTTGPVVTHTYVNSGSYSISLAIAASGGQVCVQYATVNYFSGILNCAQLQASIGYTVSNGLTVYFENNSTFPGAPGVLRVPAWDFGDGTTSALQYPVKQYAPGTYTVTLTNQWVDSNTQAVLCTDADVQTLTLVAPPNEISGAILWDSTNNITSSTFKVWLITYDATTNIIDAVDSIIATGGNGGITTYSFLNQPAGIYRVKAAVLSGAAGASLMAPTYSYTSLNWSTASLINHINYSPSNYIYMQAGSSTNGPGFIAGNVTLGAGKGTSTGVPNLLILLRNLADQMVRFTYTDANGDYSFGNLPAGNYTVYPENMPQVTTPSSTISLASGAYTVSGIDFVKNSVSIKPVATGIAQMPEEDIFDIYPNPSGGIVRFNWNTAITGKALILVTDVAGRQVYSAYADTRRSITLPLGNLPSGIYLIRIRSDKAQHTEKLVIQR